MTVTKQSVAISLIERFPDLSKADAQELVSAFFDELSETLAEGESISFSGFATFELRDKKARVGRNPRTGECKTIYPRRLVLLRLGRKLRARLKSQFTHLL